MLVQVFTLVIITLIVLLLSDKLKSHLQTLFAGILILLIPLILKTMGFDFAGWLLLLPIYTMSGLLLKEHGAVICISYLGVVVIGIVVFIFGCMKKKECLPNNAERGKGEKDFQKALQGQKANNRN